MNNNKKSQVKQLIILVIILIAVFVISFCVEKFLINSNDSETDEVTITSEIEAEEEEYTINGMTKEQWENQKAFIDEDNYETVMALFEEGLEEDIEIDFETLETEEENESISQEDLDEITAIIQELNSESSE